MTKSLPPESWFSSIFESYDQRYAAIVYRLIDATLIEIFFLIHSYFKVKILATFDQLDALGGKGFNLLQLYTVFI